MVADPRWWPRINTTVFQNTYMRYIPQNIHPLSVSVPRYSMLLICQDGCLGTLSKPSIPHSFSFCNCVSPYPGTPLTRSAGYRPASLRCPLSGFNRAASWPNIYLPLIEPSYQPQKGISLLVCYYYGRELSGRV